MHTAAHIWRSELDKTPHFVEKQRSTELRPGERSSKAFWSCYDLRLGGSQRAETMLSSLLILLFMKLFIRPIKNPRISLEIPNIWTELRHPFLFTRLKDFLFCWDVFGKSPARPEHNATFNCEMKHESRVTCWNCMFANKFICPPLQLWLQECVCGGGAAA